MVLYQICVFGADLKSNMAAMVHNVFTEIREEWDNWINNYYMPLERYRVG
jgi:hypothetical protein